MTAADDFTRADALFRRALAFKARDGAPIQIMPSRKLRYQTWTAVCAGLAAIVFCLTVMR